MKYKNIKTILLFAVAFCFIFALSVFAAPQINYTVEELTLSQKTAPVTPTFEDDSGNTQLFASVFSGGAGTEDDPYLISTIDDLEKFSNYVNIGARKYVSAYYKLENDINLNGAEWSPVGNYVDDETGYTTCFQGVFDGNNKSVSNFVITTSDNNYTGFFGFIYNGTVKNFTVSDFEIELESNSYVYTGALAGRVLSVGENISSGIENCHAVNGKINATSRVRVYAGGLIGYLHASDNAKQYLKNSSSDADVSFTLSNSVVGSSFRYIMSVGGLVGYVASIDNAETEILRSYATGTVSAITTDVNKFYNNSPHVGGFAGDIGTQNGGKLDISECFSTSGVFLKSDAEVYAGSMFGYAISNNAGMSISDSHTNANVYAYSTTNDSYISGFSGIVATQGTSSSLTLDNIYSASNVIYTGKNKCDGGRITSYTTGNVTTQNCYAVQNSVLYVTNNIVDIEDVISKETSVLLDAYEGFDARVWNIDSESVYPYPVLNNNPVPDVEYTMYFASENGEYFTKTLSGSFGSEVAFPEQIPESQMYEFSHWSLIPASVDATGYKISSDTLFFPNYSSYRIYNIKFIANEEEIDSLRLPYGTSITFPEAPEKAADAIFTYAFSHWSKTIGGEAIDTSTETVTGEACYYAVYKSVPPHIWNGVSAKDFRGSGTQADPYIIKSPYNLYKLSNLVNSGNLQYAEAYYKLSSDINLGNYEWTPIGTKDNPFKGHFNGDGYSIHSFKITADDTQYAGIFGYAENAEISQLKATDFVIEYTQSPNGDEETTYAGGIVGYILTSSENSSAVVSQCMTQGTITVNAEYAYTGGVVGYAFSNEKTKLLISNCFSCTDVKAETTSSSAVGGIIGAYYGSNNKDGGIEFCGFSGTANAVSTLVSYSAGIVAYLSDAEPHTLIDDENSGSTVSTIRNCFSAASKLTSVKMGTSYAGYVHAYKDTYATIKNCFGTNQTVMSASRYSSIDNITLTNNISKFYLITYLSDNIGLDLQNVWSADGASLPVLKVFNKNKNIFEIVLFEYKENGSEFSCSFNISYNDQNSYTVLAASYDERGKMIAFTAKTINNPTELQTVSLSISNIEDATYTTVSVINPTSFNLLEETIKLYK